MIKRYEKILLGILNISGGLAGFSGALVLKWKIFEIPLLEISSALLFSSGVFYFSWGISELLNDLKHIGAKNIQCSKCNSELKLNYNERISKKFLCPECESLIDFSTGSQKVLKLFKCPSCGSILVLEDNKIILRKYQCSQCRSLISFSFNPPRILNRQNNYHLLSSLKQGDIALIKSILDNSNIAYYVFGENNLSIFPSVEATRFYVPRNQMKEAKKITRGFINKYRNCLTSGSTRQRNIRGLICNF